MPSNNLDLYLYRFVLDAGATSGSHPTALIPACAAGANRPHRAAGVEVLRHPRVREGFIQRRSRGAFLAGQAAWGPGRVIPSTHKLVNQDALAAIAPAERHGANDFPRSSINGRAWISCIGTAAIPRWRNATSAALGAG
jgi:hypothetical protein